MVNMGVIYTKFATNNKVTYNNFVTYSCFALSKLCLLIKDIGIITTYIIRYFKVHNLTKQIIITHINYGNKFHNKFHYTEKLSPHPHVPLIFGLLNTNSELNLFST